MWFALAACTPDPAKPPDDTGPPEETGDSADTDTDTDTDTGEPVIDCPVQVAETSVIVGADLGHDPLPFDLRSDGDVWFGASDGVYLGTTPSNATLVWPTTSEVRTVREADDGTLWFEAGGMLWHVPAGEPVAIAAGLLATDLEFHPSGAVMLVARVSSPDRYVLVYVDPAGGVETREIDFPVWSAAWASTGEVWLLGAGLWTLPADTEGRSDGSVAPTRVLEADAVGSTKGDLASDACGGIAILSFDFPFGRLSHYTPATDALVTLPGRVDQGYGDAPLRFDRVPGRETQLRTSTGGWSTTARTWISWDLGVPAP